LSLKREALPLRRQSWDVVVIGAGPAGSMSAIGLTRSGFSVLLVERSAFPRHKVCGCCLNLAAVQVLKDAGLFPTLRKLGARPLAEFRLYFKGREVSVRLPGGYAVSRATLDTALVESAEQQGTQFLQGVRASLEELRSDGCSIALVDRSLKQSIRANVVLCADGLSGSFLSKHPKFVPEVYASSRIGLSALLPEHSVNVLPGSIGMAIGSSGYAGFVAVEDRRINLAAAIDAQAIKEAGGSSELALQGIFKEAGLPVPAALECADWKGTPPLTRRRHLVGDRRLIVLGDAAGYVEPFTGEGMAWAMASGQLAVPLVRLLAVSPSIDLGCEWQRMYGNSIRRRQWICRILRRILRSEGLLRVAAHASPWMHFVVSSLNRPFPQEVAPHES